MTPPPTKTKQSVAVIGAGVVGLCSAIELLRSGYAVTLYDKDAPAKQTSFGNAGYLAAEYSEPLATFSHIASAIQLSFSEKSAFKVSLDHLPTFIPWTWHFLKAALPSNVAHSKRAMRNLNAHAVAAWKDMLDFAGTPELLINSGFMQLWERSKDIGQTEKAQAAMQAIGIKTEILKHDALMQKEPAVSTRLSHALYYPGSYRLHDPYLSCCKLFECFEQNGGVFHADGVQKITPSNNGVTINTSGEQAHFTNAIISAGVWSKQLLKQLQLDVPLAAERGYHLTLPHTPMPSHVLASADRHVVLSPLANGLRIVGFGEYANLDSKPNAKRYQQLKHHLHKIIPGVDPAHKHTQTWMGNRPTLPDSLPVIDLHPDYPQIGMVFGHHHLGVTQAAISARIISALLNDNAQDKLPPSLAAALPAYSVRRFSRQYA